MSTRTLLVTGAAGQLGRRVVALLLAAKAGRVIAATRDPKKIEDLAAQGAELRPLDFDGSPESIAAAFAGVDRALIVSTDAVGVPGQRLAQHKNAIAAAKRAGVKHLAYTSFVNPTPDNPAAVVPDHRLTEEALLASGLGYTFLRNNLYADLLLQSLPGAVQSGQLFSAAGEGKISYVTREDCAQAAAGALLSTQEGNFVYDVTGPHALSQHELAGIASELGGKAVQYIPLTPEALTAGMVANGLPAPIAELLVSFDRAAARGDMAMVSDAVRALSGRAPTSVLDFLRANLAALRPA